MTRQTTMGNTRKEIVVVGAGPAGSSVAIRLADAGHSVTIIERERFPRHKLCGEFISPECIGHFREIGVSDAMLSSGGQSIKETRFYAASGRSVGIQSEIFGGNALSLSRARMDDVLLERARSAGVRVLTETAVIGVELGANGISSLRVRNESGLSQIEGSIFIDATGRAGTLSKLSAKKADKASKTRQAKQPGFVGFKQHVRGAKITPGTCEIYFFPGGYGGVTYIENGLANHCFIMTSERVRSLGADQNRILTEAVFRNRRAQATLSNADPVGDRLAVAVDSFGSRNTIGHQNLFSVGDAAAFIDPFTGSGMLLALESSRVLSDCLIESDLETLSAVNAYTLRYAKRFCGRLRTSSLLRRAAFVPGIASFSIFSLFHSQTVMRTFARATRRGFSLSRK